MLKSGEKPLFYSYLNRRFKIGTDMAVGKGSYPFHHGHMPQRKMEKNLGLKILHFRQRQGMTQQQAAELYGCSLRWWQKVEQGRNISVFVLSKVGTVLSVESWKLLKP